MRKSSLFAAVMFAAAVLAVSSRAVAQPQFGTAAEAKAMLQKAVAALKADKATALSRFTKGESGFKDRDLYVFCSGADGCTSAHCEKLAAETFRRETANDEDRVNYRAHYNARLNKCFYAETYISHTPVGINRWVYLSDLQENRIYGGFHRSTNIGLFYCNLQDKECHSEAEWNRLVKPYMED